MQHWDGIKKLISLTHNFSVCSTAPLYTKRRIQQPGTAIEEVRNSFWRHTLSTGCVLGMPNVTVLQNKTHWRL